MNNKQNWLLQTSLLSLGMVLMPSLASAQSSTNDEIIVTATKRQQTLRETPISVSVTSADVLEKAQILDIQDLQSVVPSLRVGQLQNSANTNFRIRGFGNGANNAGIEPSVGVFIDGVYRSRSAAQIGDLPKLERIEVLSGPQSTLFGKNASAGVISVVTAEPSFEAQGYLEAGFGNYNQRLFRGYATGGLSDTFAISVGGTLNKRDGYAESAVTGLEANNSRDRFSIRGQALFVPRDDISIRLIADYSEIDELCCHVTNVNNDPARTGAIQLLGGRLADPENPFAFVNFSNIEAPNEIQDGGLSLHVDVDFDRFTLTSITALRNNTAFNKIDADFTTADILENMFDTEISTFTQEVRLTSTGDNKLDWMVGGYYFSEDITLRQQLLFGDSFRPFADLLSGGNLATLESFYGATPGSFLGPDTFTDQNFTQDDVAYSGFVSASYHINDKLTVTGGLNYTNDKKNITTNVIINEPYSNIDLVNDPTLLPGGPTLPQIIGPAGTAGLQGLQFLPQFVDLPNSIEDGITIDDKITWSARLAYEVTDNINAYVSAGTGFKASSWNLSRDSRPFAVDATALTTAGLTQPNQTFGTRLAGPEEATVYEFGLKARFDKTAFNIAVFDQSIDGFQSNTFIGTGFVLANAGKQSTFGVEFDASYRPIEPLKLTFAGIYLDAKYDSFINAPGPGNTIVDRSGDPVAGVPEFGFSTSATWTHEFNNGMSGFVRGDYQYESEVDIVEILGVKANTSIFNGSLGIKTESGFGIQIWGRNIFGHKSFISAFPGVVQGATINVYPTAPATYGVLLRKEF